MKQAIIGFMVAAVLATVILTTHNDAHAGASCFANGLGDNCASDEYCYVKSHATLGQGVCVRVTFIKQVP